MARPKLRLSVDLPSALFNIVENAGSIVEGRLSRLIKRNKKKKEDSSYCLFTFFWCGTIFSSVEARVS